MMPGGFFIQTKIPGRVTEDATNRNFIVLLLSVWEVERGEGRGVELPHGGSKGGEYRHFSKQIEAELRVVGD